MGTLLGTEAPIFSDLVALTEVGIAAGLLIGTFVVRRGHVRAHRIIQSALILVNIPIVLAWMVPEFLLIVLPGLPGDLDSPFYYIPTLMLCAGAAAEGLGIYIILAAGTNLLPLKYRFRRYKLWMRTELALWWSVVSLGLTTYLVWYVLPLNLSA
ncbi:MAG TPA: hypothetical protein VJS68_03940 [Thermoplasmata archaeon]|nr:hypothetical protein [Thermoplasmata archaeon]